MIITIVNILPLYEERNNMPKGIKGFQKGKDNPYYGKHSYNFGKQASEEVKKKLSISHLGQKLSEKSKKKISLANKGKKKPPRSEEHRKKISEFNSGKRSHFWIDGRSKGNYQYPQDWKENLKESIRQRDNYICQECGTHQSELNFGQVKKLDIHHIDYDKDNLDPINLISLCRRCHMKTNYNRSYWIEYFSKGIYA